MPTHAPTAPDANQGFNRFFLLLAGLVFGLTLIKLGNPVIFEQRIEPPQGWLEVLFLSWPISWGHALLMVLVATGALAWWLAGSDGRSRALPLGEDPKVAQTGMIGRAIVWLPAAWLLWQLLAATRSVEARLTATALPHFAACVACYYLGYFLLSRAGSLRFFRAGLLLGFLITLLVGLDQHFGGLEETRRQYEQMDWSKLSPEMRAQLDNPQFRARMASNRIFSTFVYPNAFAGCILLLLPLAVQTFRELGQRLSRGRTAPWAVAAIPLLAGLACLYWSGSKAGWLIALVVAVVLLMHQPLPRRFKVLVAGVLLAGGLAGFFGKYTAYFERGATSVGARFDYWRAALTVARDHPFLGTGPGTFSVLYRRLKPPEAEMARLAHNDYLQQACDSGWPGFLIFTGFVVGSLLWLRAGAAASDISFPVWLGLLGWTLQSVVEFGLYIPALAWPAFLFFGWLAALGTRLERPSPSPSAGGRG